MKTAGALALLLPLLAGDALEATDALEISARIEPSIVAPGDIATLTVEVSGGGSGRLDLDATFELDNLERLRPIPSRAESFQWVNGRASRTVTLAWPLRAIAEGPARVFNLVARSGASSVPLAEQALTVSKETPAAAAAAPRRPRDLFEEFFGRAEERPRPARSPKVFVRAEVEPRSVYVGQQALYSLYLYTQADIESVQQETSLDFQGFWARDMPRPDKQRPETVDYQGERYARFLLARKAIFPLAPGTQQLGSSKVSLAVSEPRVGGFGLIPRTVEVRRETNAASIEVLPLPPAPEGFGGAVGKLKVESHIEPPLVQVGEAATLTVTLTGEGNLQGLRSPSLPTLAGLRSFPPQQESIDEIRGNVVRGKRSWKYVLVPEIATAWNLPPVEVPYFDPAAKKFAVARSEALIFTAQAPIEMAAPPRGEVTPARASAAASPEPARQSAAAAWPWKNWLPWGLTAVFATAFALALLTRRQRPVLALHAAMPPPPPPGATLAATATRTLRRLDPARRDELRGSIAAAQREEHGRQVANAVEEAIRQAFVTAWALPESTPASQWRARLAEGGAPEDLLRELESLLADLRYLRFAPQLSSPVFMKSELCTRALRLIDAMSA